MTLVAQLLAEMVCSAASLHRHHAARQLRRQLDHTVPLQAPPQNDPPTGVQTHDTAAVLAQVDPQNRDLHRTSSHPSACPASLHHQEGGAGHPIKLLIGVAATDAI